MFEKLPTYQFTFIGRLDPEEWHAEDGLENINDVIQDLDVG